MPPVERPRPVFAFLDESGTIHGPDRFFAIGLLRCEEPAALLRPLQRWRDIEHFREEIKWSDVSASRLPTATFAVDVFFDSGQAAFSAFVVDKERHDVVARFGGHYAAYEALARQVIRWSLRRGETMWVVADEYPSPPTETFENNIRDSVNRTARNRSVAGVVRMRSGGSDLLQVADLLLGAIVFDYKRAAGIGDLPPRRDLTAHLLDRCGAACFAGGFRSEQLDVREYHGPAAPRSPVGTLGIEPRTSRL